MENAHENTRGTLRDRCAGPIDPSSGAIRLDESSAARRDREAERGWAELGNFSVGTPTWEAPLTGREVDAGAARREAARLMHTQGRGIQVRKVGFFVQRT
tara:strand:- start:174 stop:473 length:300 start_codon:yes stop_codon:yes gene_type:complete